MKNFNLLRKSERKSVGTTLALTVGSPSFDRRGTMLKHYAFMLLFLLGSLNVWGYTITFSTGSGDGTSASTSTACSTIVSEGASYLSGNLDTATKVYYSGNDGLKLGASSNAGTIKMNLASSVTPTSIVVRAKYYSSKKTPTLKVNGSATQEITSSSFSDYNFDITSSISYIQLESSKYCWIESITVNTGTPNPTVSAEPNKVEFGTKNIYGGANTTGNIDVAVTGSHLTGNITATLSGDDAAKFSISGAPFAPTAGSASGTLVVSYEVTEARDYKALVTLSSEGADDVELPISLSAVNIAPIVYNKVTDAAELMPVTK